MEAHEFIDRLVRMDLHDEVNIVDPVGRQLALIHRNAGRNFVMVSGIAVIVFDDFTAHRTEGDIVNLMFGHDYKGMVDLSGVVFE